MNINPGDLRTQIEIKSPTSTTGSNGYEQKEWKNVFGEGVYTHCKWINVHGIEVYEAQKIGLKEPATITLRYSSKITPVCQIYKKGDAVPFEIISVNDIMDRHVWLEIKVQRKVSAV
jgi:head-tail adaptor